MPCNPGPRVETDAGIELATWSFGGDGPPLLLAHPAGFHGRAWDPLATALTTRFSVWALDHRGHGASGHASDGRYDDWRVFADDVLAVVDALSAASLVDPSELRGGGHSLGGTALLMATQRRRGLFRSLFCYEPIVPSPDFVRRGLSSNPLVEITLRRRESFPSLEAVRESYATKPPFKQFTEAALDAYVTGGFTQCPDGTVRLACRPTEESSIYAGGLLHDCYQRLGEVIEPVTFARGDADGETAAAPSVDGLPSLVPHATLQIIPGCGHFGPMEEPARLAEIMVAALE